MRTITFLFVALLLLLPSVTKAQASTVTFSSTEGYINGALNNQNSWTTTVTYPGAWTVNANTSTLTTEKDWQQARWGNLINLTTVGSSITFRIEFDCEIETMSTSGSLLQIGFINSTNFSATGQGASSIHVKKSTLNLATTIQMRINSNTAGLTPNAELEGIIASNSTRTKLMAAEVTLTRGADAASSTMKGKIINLTDNISSELGSYTGIDATLYNSMITTGVYSRFATQANICRPTVYKVSMSNVFTSTKVTKNDEMKVSIANKQLKVTGLELNDEVRVYSLTGTLCVAASYSGQVIDLSKLPNGYYMLKSNNLVRKILLD